MNSQAYPIPEGLHAISLHHLDLRSDIEIDHDLTHPIPVSDEKNIWFFWHSGFTTMHPYTKRNIRIWHRRFSKQGWVIRVLDRSPSSPLNIVNFLDVSDMEAFPRAFIDGTIGGDYAPQHTSDLVRWPLLLKYGGVYADVGMIQIGDIDRLWCETIGNPNSRFEVFSYNMGGVNGRNLANYFLASGKDNPLFARCHKLLLELWATDGGKTSTDGMHRNPLLKGLPLMGATAPSTLKEGDREISADEVGRMLTDYIIQRHVMTMVMSLIDEEDRWYGPEYVAKHVFAMEFMEGSQLINYMTAWNGPKQFGLMSLSLPTHDETETVEQKEARIIVEACLQRSFGCKLAHGLILRVMGDTLGSLWRRHEGSDDVPGTYAHWLRYGTLYWNRTQMPTRLDFQVIEPLKRGPLLREV